MNVPDCSIVLTGEWPGVGQSTTAGLLAQKLNFRRVYAGFLFRKFGYIWNLEKKNLSWSEFESQVAHNQLNLDKYEFTEADFSEALNHQFQHQLKNVNTPELWDKIIDQQSLDALQKPHTVVEGKVGVLLDQTNLIDNFHPSHSVFKILLTCPPEISSHRILQRKVDNGELPPMDQNTPQYHQLVRQTTTETIDRHLRDWERYEKIYGIKRSDIYSQDIHQVDTSKHSKQQVVAEILQLISTNK